MGQPEQDLRSLQPSERAAEVNQVFNALMEQMERSSSPHKRFITDYDLKQFITLHRRPLFEFEPWEEEQVQFVIDNCAQVLATLILCSAYTQIKSIRGLFFKQAPATSGTSVLTDEQLWIHDERKLMNFLPSGPMRDNFMSMQYTVKPYRFKEETPSETQNVPSPAHLPFKEEIHNVGVGGYGRISKVLVAHKYLVRANLSEYHEDEWCALKQIQASDAFLQEVRQLQILKESLTTHERILQHYVSFVHDRTFNILLPLAKYGDLEIFLNEGRDPVDPEEGSKIYDFKATFPTFKPNDSRCTSDLFTQFWGIADAVNWLHDKDSKSVYLMHMDLKPANILVMEDFSKSEKRSSVGMWRLSDFGLSVVKSDKGDRSYSPSTNNHGPRDPLITIYDALKQGDSSNVTDSSRTVPQRREGTYQAPEVALRGRRDAVGPRSDIWSLACIFSEVISFAVGGWEKVSAFQEHRQRLHSDDFFYSQVDVKKSSAPQSGPRFKRRSTVDEWLKELQETEGFDQPSHWIKCGVQIVKTALSCNQDARPNAASFSKDIEHFKDHYLDQVSSQTETPHCPILRRYSTASQADGLDRFVSRQQTQASIQKEESSPSDSGRVSNDLPSGHPSSQTGTFSDSDNSHPRLFSHDNSHTNQESRDISISTRKAVDIHGCRSTAFILVLYPNCLNLIDVRASVARPILYDIPPEIEWEHVRIAGSFAAIWGHEGKGKEGQKHVMLWNLEQSYSIRLRPYGNPILAKVSNIAVSHMGLVALQCDFKILLYNIGTTEAAGLPAPAGRDASNASSASLACIELASEEDYHFDKLEFSPSGNTLIAWAWGSRLKNAIFRWDVYAEPMRCRRYHLVETRQQACPTTIDSLLLPSGSGSDECINCLVQETDGNLFAVSLTDETEAPLPRDYVAADAKDASLLIIYNDTHLIAVTRKHRVLRRRKCHIAAYPLYWGSAARSEQSDFGADFEDLLADNEDYCLQLVDKGSALALAVVGFNGKLVEVPIEKR